MAELMTGRVRSPKGGFIVKLNVATPFFGALCDNEKRTVKVFRLVEVRSGLMTESPRGFVTAARTISFA